MKERPLVSVIVPTYNRAYCLERTLNSVLAQTYPHWEVIVVDDGSTDETPALMQRFSARDPRFRYIRRENGGVSAARNTGLRAASGDCIALLDSDDVWFPWKLQLQVACLAAHPEAGMVWTDMEAVTSDGTVRSQAFLRTMYGAYRYHDRDTLFASSEPLAELFGRPDLAFEDRRLYWGDIFSQMVAGSLVHTSTVLMTRERFERVGLFNEALLISGEDFEFHLRTCREGPVAYADVSSIQYQTGRGDQLTAPEHHVHMARNFLTTLNDVVERDRGRINLPPEMIRTAQAHAHAWLGEELFDSGERREARTHLADSLKLDHLQLRIFALLTLTCLPASLTPASRKVFRGMKTVAHLMLAAVHLFLPNFPEI